MSYGCVRFLSYPFWGGFDLQLGPQQKNKKFIVFVENTGDTKKDKTPQR